MSRPIKVLHVLDKFGKNGSSIHGISRLLIWWLPRFDRSRYDAQLIGLRKPDGASETLRQQGLEFLSLSKSKFDVSTLPALVHLVRQERAHILHLHGYGASNFGRMAARSTGIKTVIHEHFVDPAMPFYQGAMDRMLSGWIDRGIAVSRSVKEFMVHRRFMPEDRVRVVYNGAPLQEFQPVNGAPLADARWKWGIPDDYAVVTSVGRLDEQKGNTYLLDAAAMLVRKGCRIKVMIVGDGPLLEGLKNQSRRLGIEQAVVFTGYQSNISLLQSLSTIQVFPSLYEGTPLTLFEAMAMRRPIVATPVDGLGEVLRDGENALLVPPRDVERFADAIEELLAHPAKARRLASQAQIDSRQFDIQHTVDQIQEIYDELMNGSPR